MTANISPRDETLHTFVGGLRDAEADPEIVAAAGSGSNDIDLFVILTGDDGPFLREYYTLIDKIKRTQEIVYNNTGTVVSSFPTLHLEIFDRKLIDDAEPVQLHLLVYPNYDCFISWEDPLLVKTVSASAEVLLGNETRFRDLLNRVETPPFAQRIRSKYILSLLLDTHQYLRAGASKKHIRLADSVHKATYVVRYMVFHRLLEGEKNISQIDSWSGLSTHIHCLSNEELKSLFETCKEWRQSESSPDINEVIQVLEASLSIIEEWFVRTGDPSYE